MFEPCIAKDYYDIIEADIQKYHDSNYISSYLKNFCINNKLAKIHNFEDEKSLVYDDFSDIIIKRIKGVPRTRFYKIICRNIEGEPLCDGAYISSRELTEIISHGQDI